MSKVVNFLRIVAALVMMAVFTSHSFALSPEERLSDEVSEQRAMSLFLQVRCLVCEGQVIENSDTEFSFEMRKLIRSKISAGKSDDEIKAELVAEFGEDILTNVGENRGGFLLWLLPVLFAMICAVSMFFSFHKKAASS